MPGYRMKFLDPRTVIFIGIVTYIICTVVIVLLWRNSRKGFAGTAFWAADFAFQTAALILIVLRGTVPDWMSIVLANAMVMAGAVLGYMGLERFLGKRGPQVQNYLLLAVFTSVHAYFAFIEPSLFARNLNISITLMIICFQCTWLLLIKVEKEMRPMTRAAGFVFGGYCLVSFFRIAELFIAPQLTNDFFRSGSLDLLFVIAYQMLFILLTYSLVLMVNKYLSMDIRTQEEKFSKAFRSSPYAVMITRMPDGTILEVNNGFERITGYTSAEVMGKTTQDLDLWLNAEDRAAVIGELSARGTVRDFESKYRIKSGEIITGLISSDVITINGLKAILSSINDITERKLAEDALRERLKELRCHYEISALLELRGVGLVQLLERAVALIPPAVQYPEIAAARIIIENTGAETARFRPTDWMMCQDIFVNGAPAGRMEVCYLEERPAIDEGPFMKEERQLINDIAERIGRFIEKIKAEGALRESEEKYRLLHESSGVGVGYYRPDGTVISYNRLAAAHMGGRPEDFTGRSIYNIFPKQEAEFYHNRIEKAVVSDNTVVYEDLVPLPTGDKYFLSTFTKIMDSNNAVSGIQIISQDITERKQMENKLIVAIQESDILREKAEKASREKELILKEVHHRIKNNMSAIKSLLSLQSETMKDPGAASALKDAENRVQSMATLYDKLYRGDNFGAVSIDNYLSSLADEIIGNFPNKGIVAVEKHIEPFSLEAGTLFPLGIIINELLTNTMKHAFTGRHDGLITVSASRKDNRVTITIGDNGTGLPESVDIKSSGGFGMKLVGLLIKQIRGTIAIERRKGTKFILEFEA